MHHQPSMHHRAHLHRHQRALRAIPKVEVVNVLITGVVAQVAQPRVQLGRGSSGCGSDG